MPKLKTHKTAAKRFKTTGSGKISRRQTSTSHKLTNKSANHKRRLQGDKVVVGGNTKRIRRMMGM